MQRQYHISQNVRVNYSTLRAEGMDQAEIGAALGVAQQTIQEWLQVSNTGPGNAYPGNRVKVSKDWQAVSNIRSDKAYR